MKLMKNISLTALLSFALLGTVTFSSCSRDECKDVVCQNGGTCDENDGSCACPTGYEGDLCQTLVRDRFIGTYNGSEICTVGTDTYTLTIAANSDALKLTLTNLYRVGYTAICTVTGSNTFSFSGTQSGATFSGNGTLSGNQISVTYQLSDGTTSNSCTFTGTR